MPENRKFFDSGCPRSKLQATNWLEDVSGNSDCNIVEVAFKNTRMGYYINSEPLDLKIGDMVVVESQPGYDIGRVNMTGRLVRMQMRKAGIKDTQDLKNVLRFAGKAEMERADEAHSREHETMIRSRKIAEDLSLNMKIGDVEYQADAAKAIFYYIADERVDFRTLIRVLADTFKVRVEMRQIGARQEAGRIGGIGPCGRPLCCSQWMTKFNSVGTGAARIQDISMNPQKLAGQCAKLKCCLNFEMGVYAEAQKQLPGKDVQLETKDNTYYLFKSDILAHVLTYSTDRKIPANLVTISAARAFEIIALNKQGVKPDSLLSEGQLAEGEQKKVVDLAEQDDLTRFDKSKRRKKKKSNGAQQSKQPRQQGQPNGQKQQNGHKPQGQPNGQKPQGQKQQGPRQNRQRNNQPQPDQKKQQPVDKKSQE